MSSKNFGTCIFPLFRRSFWAIVWVAYASVFVIPAVWRHHGDATKNKVSALLNAARKKAEDLGITRGMAALLQTMVVASVFLNLSSSNRVAIVIVGTIAARCQLNPAEVRVEPVHRKS